ncbi:MAG: hypothetical protein R3F24_09315 [Gammaproteobacteria bacterium]
MCPFSWLTTVALQYLVEITPEAAGKLDHSADTRPQIVVDGPRQVTVVGYAVMTAAFMHGQLYYAHSGDSGRTFSAPFPSTLHSGRQVSCRSTLPWMALFA